MDAVINSLKKLGFYREKEDFDPKKFPRPLLTLQRHSKEPLVRVIVGLTWTTIYKIVDPCIIEEIDSAHTDDLFSVQCLAKRIAF